MARGTPLRLTLIGRFALWRGSQQIGVVGSGQRLIALLALRDRPVGRMHVAGTLWPDCPTERSLADLRTTLWRVNQSGEQPVLATRPCSASTPTTRSTSKIWSRSRVGWRM